MSEPTKIYVNDMDSYGAWNSYIDQDLGDEKGGSYPFEEGVVICGNDRMTGMTNASWYKKARELVEMDVDEMREYLETRDLTDAQKEKFLEIARCQVFVETEQAAKIANVLFPNDTFECFCIRGSSQSDWNYCIIKNRCIDKNELEQYYFGEVAEVYSTSDNIMIHAWITQSEMWKAERDGSLVSLCKERLDIPDEVEAKVFVSNGMIQTIDWKEVEDRDKEETEEEVER